jgi:hypothetical protein
MTLLSVAVVILAISLGSSTLYADIYYWTDENGIINFSNYSPPPDAKIFIKDVKESPPDSTDIETAAIEELQSRQLAKQAALEKRLLEAERRLEEANRKAEPAVEAAETVGQGSSLGEPQHVSGAIYVDTYRYAPSGYFYRRYHKGYGHKFYRRGHYGRHHYSRPYFRKYRTGFHHRHHFSKSHFKKHHHRFHYRQPFGKSHFRKHYHRSYHKPHFRGRHFRR